MKTIKLLMFLAGLLFITSTNAQQNCDICASALKQDIMSYKFSQSLVLDYLNIIDESSFQSIKKDGSFSFNVPIDVAQMLNQSADYHEFNNKRAAYFNLNKYTLNRDQSLEILTKKISADGYNSFNMCMEKCLNSGKDKVGFYAYLIKSNEESATLEIEYIAPHSVAYPLIIESSDLTFGKYKNKSFLMKKNTKMNPGSKIGFDISRDSKNGKIQGIINAKINNVSYPVSFATNAFYIPKIDTVTTTLILKEDENCNINGCKNIKNIIDIQFTECLAKMSNGDLYIDKDPKSHELCFGPWDNIECFQKGTGWSGKYDSCSTNRGSKRMHVLEVTAVVKYLITK